LTAAKRTVLAIIGEAHGAGFAVQDDLSVTDRQIASSRAERTMRRAEADAFHTEIASSAATLVITDNDLADRITSASAAIQRGPQGVIPDPSPTYEAAGFFTAPFPEKPPNPAPTPPPDGWSADPLTRAAQKIAYGHSFDKHAIDFTGMTRAQLAREIERMFRANER
jgi:hypothetical protein